MTEPYAPNPYAAPPAPPPAAPAAPSGRRLSPLWQTAVIAFVGLTVAGALVAMGMFSPGLFVLFSLAGTVIAVAVAGYAVVQGWRPNRHRVNCPGSW